MKRITGLAAALVLALGAATAAAEETPITVRVISQGAKFIGSSMGGVRVVLADAGTGEVLARGRTRGGTGDTGRIMTSAHPRGTALSTEGAAKFDATIDIDRPTKVRVRAHGPLAQAQAANTVTATRWVVPGKGITAGDGWLLEMPGFMVDLQTPPAHRKLSGLPQTVRLSANVTMMCGCPITPGGLWDAEQYEVAARIRRDGEMQRELALNYAGTASQFARALTVEQPGLYEVTVYAYDPQTGNTGLDRTTFIVSE